MRVAVLPTGGMELRGLPSALTALFPGHEFYFVPKRAGDEAPFDSFTSSGKPLVRGAPNGNVTKIVQAMAAELAPGRDRNPADLLVVLEDLEVPNKPQPGVVVDVFRDATLAHLQDIRRRNVKLAMEATPRHLDPPRGARWRTPRSIQGDCRSARGSHLAIGERMRDVTKTRKLGALFVCGGIAACGSSINGTSPSSSSSGHGGASTSSTSAAGGAGGAPACADPGASTCKPSATTAQSKLTRQPPSSIPPDTLAAAVTANNAFTVDFYQQAIAPASVAPTNVVMSPFSASVALTMTYAGAMGATATQMASVLKFGTTPSIFDGQNALLQALAGRAATARSAGGSTDSCASDYQLQVVNSVWGTSLPWESPFLDVLAESYGTGVYQTSFPSPGQDAVNAWVSCETDGKVQGLLPTGATNTCTVMVLVNALHLKLPWQSPFLAAATTALPFTTGAGSVVMPSVMSQTTSYPYVDDGKAQVVALPLMGNQLSVVIALPHGDLATYEAGLTASSAALSIPSGVANVALSLPKFKLAPPSFSLATTLGALGMTDAFDPTAANFDGLVSTYTPPPCCPARIAIGDVLQEATFAVAESGVEAAAATAVVLAAATTGTTSGPAPTSMTVNKPFLFSVVDATGAVLFVGHVQDPTMASQPSSYSPPQGC